MDGQDERVKFARFVENLAKKPRGYQTLTVPSVRLRCEISLPDRSVECLVGTIPSVPAMLNWDRATKFSQNFELRQRILQDDIDGQKERKMDLCLQVVTMMTDNERDVSRRKL